MFASPERYIDADFRVEQRRGGVIVRVRLRVVNPDIGSSLDAERHSGDCPHNVNLDDVSA
jgi:hypothetical protein